MTPRSPSWATRPRARSTRRSSRPSRPPRPARASTSSSPTAPPATRAARSRPAWTPTLALSLEPGRHPARGAGHRRRRLGRRPHQGLRQQLGRGLRRPQGQPQEHPDLGRPREGRRRGHHPEPVHLGRRAVEHRRGLRRPARAGQDQAAGARVPRRACSRTCRCSPRAPASRCRSSPPARATSCSPTRTRRSRRSRPARTSTTSSPTQTILIQNPIAVTADSGNPTAAKAFVDYALSQAGAGGLRRQGLPLGAARRSRTRTRRPIPTRPACSPSRRSAAGRPSRTSSSTRTSGVMADIFAGRGFSQEDE